MKHNKLLTILILINAATFLRGMQEKKITLIGNNNQKFTLSAKATELFDFFNSFLNAKKMMGYDNNEVSCEGMVENNVLKNIVHILEKKAKITYNSPQKKQKEAKLVQFIDSLFRHKNYDINLVKKYLITVNKLDFPFFILTTINKLYVYAHDKNTIRQIIDEKKLPERDIDDLRVNLQFYNSI